MRADAQTVDDFIWNLEKYKLNIKRIALYIKRAISAPISKTVGTTEARAPERGMGTYKKPY